MSLLAGMVGYSWAAGSGSVTVSNTGTIMMVSPLHTEGRYVKDVLNRTVYLRGVNRPSGFTASCTGVWFENGDWIWGTSYTQWRENGLRQRLQQMKDSNFNVARLIFIVDWWLNNRNTNLAGQATSISCRTAMERTVSIAQQYGIYCVLTPYMSEANQSAHEMPFPSTTLPTAQSFVNFWIQMATAFKNYPNVLFELWNEPAGDYNVWMNAAQSCISAIRNVTNQIIVVQYGYGGYFDFVTDSRIQGANILYSNHIYRYPVGATIPSSEYTYSQIRDRLLNYWRYSVAINSYPCWIGEIGAWLNYGSQETQYWNNTLNLLNEWQTGYAAWEWDQLGTGWDLQTSASAAPYGPNTHGQMLIDHIVSGS